MSLQPRLFLCVFVGAQGLNSNERDAFQPSNCKVDKAVCDGKALTSKVTATVDANGEDLRITSNSVPDHATCFQCSQVSDSCYTPAGWISEVLEEWIVPDSPSPVSSPDHVPPGTIVGIMKNGVPLYRTCDIDLTTLDGCLGRPHEADNRYHYVVAPVCMSGFAASFMDKREMFLGVAMDGFPIYNSFDSTGNWVSNDALDACHGYDPGSGYRYIANDEPPYVVGCLTGRNQTTEMYDVCADVGGGVEDRQLGGYSSWYIGGNWYYNNWSWYSSWYYNSWYNGWYNSWYSWYFGRYNYNSWYNGWYNSWYSWYSGRYNYNSWYNGWYNSWYYSGWGYSPGYYGSGRYHPWYSPAYYGSGGYYPWYSPGYYGSGGYYPWYSPGYDGGGGNYPWYSPGYDGGGGNNSDDNEAPATISTTILSSTTLPTECTAVVSESANDLCGTNDFVGDSIFDQACWRQGTDCFSNVSCAVAPMNADSDRVAFVSGARPPVLLVVILLCFGAAFSG